MDYSLIFDIILYVGFVIAVVHLFNLRNITHSTTKKERRIHHAILCF